MNEVPDYVLKAIPVKFRIKNNANMKVLRDDNNFMMVGSEIGNTGVKMTQKEAVNKCKQELSKTISNYSSIDTNSASISVVPIVMAKVNLNGNTEKETTVAYDVTIKNTYDGIEIQGDYMSGVLNDTSTSYLAGNWNVMKKVKVTRKSNTLDYTTAVNKISQHIENTNIKDKSLSKISDGKIAFVYNSTTGYYEPNWMFESEEDGITYNINCFDGTIKVIK